MGFELGGGGAVWPKATHKMPMFSTADAKIILARFIPRSSPYYCQCIRAFRTANTFQAPLQSLADWKADFQRKEYGAAGAHSYAIPALSSLYPGYPWL
jgi:hypothetical protein